MARITVQCRTLGTLALTALLMIAVSGCGLDVELQDLFLITRTGQGSKLTLLVNEDGQVSCNGGKQKMLSSSMLITARDLSDNLATDAGKNLTLPTRAGSTYSYKIRMQQGTIRFSDQDTGRRPVLAQAELFTIQAAQQVCGLSG